MAVPSTAFYCPKCKKDHISKQPGDKAARHYARIESGLYAKYDPPKPVRTEVIYKEDPFKKTADGHYVDMVEDVAEKRFIVPKNADEFFERYPKYIRRWITKKLKKTSIDATVEDWESELSIHLRSLPEESIYRSKGCTDRVQTFDPVKMHGATPARFFNFINTLLRNYFITEINKQKRQPLFITNNYSYGHVEDGQVGVVDDEYLHQHSPVLKRATERYSKNEETKLFVEAFYSFVNDKDPKVLTVLDALKDTGTHIQARKLLQIDKKTYNRQRKRITQLSKAFLLLQRSKEVVEYA